MQQTETTIALLSNLFSVPPNQPMIASWNVSLQKVRSEGKET